VEILPLLRDFQASSGGRLFHRHSPPQTPPASYTPSCCAAALRCTPLSSLRSSPAPRTNSRTNSRSDIPPAVARSIPSGHSRALPPTPEFHTSPPQINHSTHIPCQLAASPAIMSHASPASFQTVAPPTSSPRPHFPIPPSPTCLAFREVPNPYLLQNEHLQKTRLQPL
jgi:hypothetical protein